MSFTSGEYLAKLVHNFHDLLIVILLLTIFEPSLKDLPIFYFVR